MGENPFVDVPVSHPNTFYQKSCEIHQKMESIEVWKSYKRKKRRKKKKERKKELILYVLL
jgi:hypothetical protein